MRARLAALLLGALLVVVVAARSRARPAYDGPVALAAPSRVATPESEPDWRSVVQALDETRAAGFADPATADPLRWVTAGCVCLAVERAALHDLVGRGGRLDVRPPELLAVDVVAAADLAVTLTVSDVLPAYAEVDRAGRSVRVWPARAAATWTGTLVRQPDGWRWAVLEPGDGLAPAAGVDRSRPR